ncbi:Putative ABC transporter permease protein [groundwater metagenome]|uniref:Putative ABC transporter permease protein n=1 Tax=groundwater metagenome TaxID=717931 RepID=A0A098E8L0_9ZZZZ
MKNISIFTSAIVLIFILVLAALISLSVGAAEYSIEKVWNILTGHGNDTENFIIFNIRLPRIIADILVGISLALSGVVLQAIFRNPLVEPYLLGISGGAAFGVLLAIFAGIFFYVDFLFFGFSSVSVFAFSGGIFGVLITYYVARVRNTTPTLTLLLSGIIVGTLFSALIMIMMTLTESEKLHGILSWLFGSFAHITWNDVQILFPIVIVCALSFYFFSRDMNAILFGEEEAKHLGIDTENLKKILILLATLLTSVAVSVAGIIGFVGLVIPHIVRIVFGPNHKILIPFSAISGGIFMLVCDTLARTIVMPIEIPVGAITAMVGAPLFMYLLRKKKYEYFT